MESEQPKPIVAPPLDDLVAPSAELRQAVAYVYERDRSFQAIEAEVGALTVRRWEPGFSSLVRIIVGQQLSSRAARAIFQRLCHLIELTPAQFATCSDAALKEVGLSQTKTATCRRLADAILTGHLDLNTLAEAPDDWAIPQLTQIKGIGVWTAEVYLLFCLERLSSFPASDLAVQRGYQQLKKLPERPTRQELLDLTASLKPYQGVVAHLLWHYYRLYSK